jgi:hypothetical protein
MKRQQALHPIPARDACRSTRRDDMDVGICRHACLDGVEERAELDAAVPALAAADDGAGLDVRGREQAGRLAAPIVMRMVLGWPQA